MKITIHDLHKKLVEKELSAVELTKMIIAQKDKKDSCIHAYLSDRREKALASAVKIDKKIANGEEIDDLAGIPGAIKDNICAFGEKTTASSKMLENFIAPYDATIVEKLEKVGAISLGKTNLDEFAMGSSTENSAFGPSKNPWNKDHVPGGSSGGSAAAVAANEAIWALGSDTGGSIRQPASYCGLVGIKPTYGLVSRYGLLAFASSLDQIGPLVKDVTDCAIVMNAICGYDPKDSTSLKQEKKDYKRALTPDVKNLKIGIPQEFLGAGIKSYVKEAIEKALKTYENMGAKIEYVSLPHAKHAISAYYIIAPAEASSNLARYDGVSFGLRIPGDNIIEMYKKTRSKGFGEEVKRRIMLGTYVLSAGYFDAYYLKALKIRTLIKEDFRKAFEKVDVLITPTVPDVAFSFGEKIKDPLGMYMEDVCTVPVNLAGVPGISIPCGFSKGLPIGMQIIGPNLSEELLLRVAYAFEQAHPEHTQTAPYGEI